MTQRSVHFPEKERLEILRRLDRFRDWSSLDDKRLCLECQTLITGRSIRMVRDDSGALRLLCPTFQCTSIPMDWVLPTGEITDVLSSQQREILRGTKFADL